MIGKSKPFLNSQADSDRSSALRRRLLEPRRPILRCETPSRRRRRVKARVKRAQLVRRTRDGLFTFRSRESG